MAFSNRNLSKARFDSVTFILNFTHQIQLQIEGGFLNPTPAHVDSVFASLLAHLSLLCTLPFQFLSSTRSSSFINADFVELLLHFLHKGMNHSWAQRKQADKIRESSWMTTGSSPDSQQKPPQMLSICSRLIFFRLEDSSCLVLMGKGIKCFKKVTEHNVPGTSDSRSQKYKWEKESNISFWYCISSDKPPTTDFKWIGKSRSLEREFLSLNKKVHV